MPGFTVPSALRTGENASVHVHVAPGLPGFDIVGAPSGQVRAVRDRVRSALIALGWDWPLLRITVAVVPGPGAGIAPWPGLDLPIALGVLAASGQLPLPAGVHVGTLGLDGTVAPPSSALRDAAEPPILRDLLPPKGTA